MRPVGNAAISPLRAIKSQLLPFYFLHCYQNTASFWGGRRRRRRLHLHAHTHTHTSHYSLKSLKRKHWWHTFAGVVSGAGISSSISSGRSTSSPDFTVYAWLRQLLLLLLLLSLSSRTFLDVEALYCHFEFQLK